ncbi:MULTISPECIES: hypothetical protein [Terrisporobacter]|nr:MULTISPECIES: hypothetical protein [Terrisporobacter]MDU6983216.1 hypothetical protein [Terrisporobacter othiniensis]
MAIAHTKYKKGVVVRKAAHFSIYAVINFYDRIIDETICKTYGK